MRKHTGIISYIDYLKSNRKRLLIFFCILIALIVVAYILSSSVFIRPYREDYYYFQPRSWDEFMNKLLAYRYSWTGRYTTTTVFILVGLLNLWSLVPLISFSVFSMGLFFAYKKLTQYVAIFNIKFNDLVSLLLSIATAASVFFTVPHPYSSFFWASAAPIHVWSYGIMAVLLIKLFDIRVHKNKQDGSLVILSMCLLIAGLMSELATVLAILSIVSYILWIYLREKLLFKKTIRRAILPLSTLFFAFMILLFSPSALVRKAVSGFLVDCSSLVNLPQAIYGSTSQLLSMINNPTLFVFIFLVFTVIFYILIDKNKIANNLRKMRQIIGFSLMGGFFVLILNPTLLFVGTGATSQLSRSQVPALSVFIWLIMLFAMYTAISIKKLKYKKVFLVFLGCLAIDLVTMAPMISDFSRDFKNDLYERSLAYDARLSVIENSNLRYGDSCIYYLPAINIKYAQEGPDLRTDPSNWMNLGFVIYNDIGGCEVIGR